ncbi:hypothetical protein CGMCC3_g3924 [Colletotrichum fructicola]|uniref:Amidohydrolase 2 n=2 Tax=Colletotrichum fructicola (strain Nara gc5) TaxID=1213859 RepID=L2G1U6_COLFN|nr:uncharacterized protein CGMCC3_g3924 [Colletotrichum fructicola]KAE9580149.1 hypothetical protein CGMCC3_g3924 [Colletotrichum fructicola]
MSARFLKQENVTIEFQFVDVSDRSHAFARQSSRFHVSCGLAIEPLPAGSWDTHLHTFDPVKHPYEPDSPYFPPASSVQSALARMPADNYVFVMAMPEGMRPENVLESVAYVNSTLTSNGRKRQSRATVVLDFSTIDHTQLSALHSQGVRSVRIHTQGAVTKGLEGDEALKVYIETVARQIAPLGWTLDGQLKTEQWVKFAPFMKQLHSEIGIEFVGDHHFYLTAADYASEKYAAIIDLIESGAAWTKISGLTQRVGANQNLENMRLVSLGLASAAGGRRAVYGSDWPHVVSGGGSSEVVVFDEKAEAAQYRQWFGEELFRKVMVDNPARLYA